jgi:hypothetical protein
VVVVHLLCSGLCVSGLSPYNFAVFAAGPAF